MDPDPHSFSRLDLDPHSFSLLEEKIEEEKTEKMFVFSTNTNS